MAPFMYALTEFAEEDEQHHLFTDEFDIVCLSNLGHKITRKLSQVTNTYSLEYCCFVPKLEDAEGNGYTRIYSNAYEVDISGEVIVTGKFKIYTGNCVLATSNCKCDVDRRTMNNMIKWLQKRDLMKFCEILPKNG